jgi:hypothetical protein
MASYNKDQSSVVALWVLALQYRTNPKQAIKDATAPPLITSIINKLGEQHTSDSILLHKHGYDRLLTGRDIDKSITNLQREIAQELLETGIVSTIYDR